MNEFASLKHQKRFLFVVLLFSVLCAGREFQRYLDNSSALWSGFYHDRHAHCENAMGIAIALRSGDAWDFFNRLERAKVWPPTHMLLGGAIMAVTGPDHRWAVLPSLIGWIMTMTAGAWIVWRVAGGGVRGLLGAAGTWLLIASSPTSKAFALDCMLESLGAGLTTLSITLYIHACEDRSRTSRWRMLAIAMTFLFFEKYQYWMITFAGLLAAEFVTFLQSNALERSQTLGQTRQFLQRQCSREWRNPVTILGLASLAIAIAVSLRGETNFSWGERTISLYPPMAFIVITYACFLIRAVWLVVQNGWHRSAVSSPAIASQLTWHLAPITFSLLISNRLTRLIWTVGTSNIGEKPTSTFADGLGIYLQAEAIQQHTTVTVAAMAGLLALVGCIYVARAGRSATMVLAIACLGIVLTLMHPNQKPRYVLNWQPAIWILAGLGMAALYSSSRVRWLKRIRSVAAGGCVALVALAALTTDLTHRHISDHTPAGTLVPLAQGYLEHLADGERAALLSTVPDRSLYRWAHGDRRGHFNFEFPSWQAWDCTDQEIYSRSFTTWIEQTASEAVVLIDVPPTSPIFFDDTGRYAVSKSLPSLMESQQKYKLSESWEVSGATVSIWRLPSTARLDDRVERR